MHKLNDNLAELTRTQKNLDLMLKNQKGEMNDYLANLEKDYSTLSDNIISKKEDVIALQTELTSDQEFHAELINSRESQYLEL